MIKRKQALESMRQARHHELQPQVDERPSSLAPMELEPTIGKNQPAQKQPLNLVPNNRDGIGSVFDQRSLAPVDLQPANNQQGPAQKQPLLRIVGGLPYFIGYVIA